MSLYFLIFHHFMTIFNSKVGVTEDLRDVFMNGWHLTCSASPTGKTPMWTNRSSWMENLQKTEVLLDRSEEDTENRARRWVICCSDKATKTRTWLWRLTMNQILTRYKLMTLNRSWRLRINQSWRLRTKSYPFIWSWTKCNNMQFTDVFEDTWSSSLYLPL